MADRMHPYPMFPQSLTPNSLQQSQIPQQPPQSQQPDPQMISALSNPEHTRMWQMSQLQNQYRPQQSGDLAASQINHQMEFARGQALSHGQGQPIVQQIQQSFGLNAQRMNPPGPIFHDPQANQPQSLIPSNFPNVPMNTQQQMKTTYNMNPMMHAGMNNPGVSRLKMLNQQEMTRLQQSGLGAQHAPNQPTAVDMFASSSMQATRDQMHGSPHPTAQPVGPPGANQGMVPGNQQPTVQKRMLTTAEFQERKSYLLSLISQSETNLSALMQNARNAGSVDPHMQQKISQLRTELVSRKDMYTKFVATFGAMLTQQMANGMVPSNMAHINPMVHSTSQLQQAAVSNPQVQPGFVTQANQPVGPQYKFPTGNGPSPMPTQSQGALNQQIPIQPAQIARPNTIPPRTGGTPHQIPSGQLPNTMSPNLGNFIVQSGQKVPDQTRQSATGVMPLDKQRFETTYAQFCRSQGTNPGSRVQIGENRTVDLHQLHVCVMHEGGAASVTQRDMWAVIGGRLGFIQFPGNDTEPGRSGPGIAQQLHNTYEQYLQHFESAYILTVKNRPIGSPQHLMHPNSLAIGNSTTSGMSGNPPEAPPNSQHPFQNQQLIAAALRFAPASAQEMRARRVPDSMINFVERYRGELLKVYQQQAQLVAKRNAEQEQQNMVNAQGPLPSTHEQASTSLQPGTQRPPQPIGANTMVSMAGENKISNGSFAPENIAAVLHRQSPTQEQLQQAAVTIGHIKQIFQQRSIPGIAPQQIPDEQRQEYSQALEQTYKMSSELDNKLPMYFAVFKDEGILRKYIAIVLTVARQRQLLATNSPQYIISMTTLRNMQMQIHKLDDEFDNQWRAMKSSAILPAASAQQHVSLTPSRLNPTAVLVPPMQNVSQIAPHASQSNGRPTSINPTPSQQPPPTQSQLQPPPQPHPQPNPQLQSQQPMLQQVKKNFQPSISPSPSAPPPPATLASPTPTIAAASSSTPATSAPTPQPTNSSPQTPKSPPSKAAAKTKAPTRMNRKMSSASRGPATPETTPVVVGAKRPPEEDVAATFTSVGPSEAEASNAPSPKKARTEWEGEPSEVLVKKKQEIENINTDDEAAAFLDCVKELFTLTASADNEIHHNLTSTFHQLLAGVAQDPADAAATAAALSAHGTGDTSAPPTALSPHLAPANDAFLEFIDFSSFTTLEDEDSDSKAPTPDLVPSSETNPSPESGSEGDSLGSTGSPDKTKIDESGDRSDPLRLGSLREIDGGESAYYQAGDWKWEGPMPTLDQPWAIFTS